MKRYKAKRKYQSNVNMEKPESGLYKKVLGNPMNAVALMSSLAIMASRGKNKGSTKK